MKFKPIPTEQCNEKTPNTNPGNPKKLVTRNQTLLEQSEQDSLTEEGERNSSSENLSNDKTPLEN
jgi:hypothetical protein